MCVGVYWEYITFEVPRVQTSDFRTKSVYRVHLDQVYTRLQVADISTNSGSRVNGIKKQNILVKM